MTMKKLLEVSDNENGILTINLDDILSCLDRIEKYHWCILSLTAVGRNEDISILDLENKINENKNGYRINATDLLEFNDLFSQIVELILIGDEDSSKLKRYENIDVTRNICSYYIELVDSSYWEISTDDSKTINNINSKFTSVKAKV